MLLAAVATVVAGSTMWASAQNSKPGAKGAKPAPTQAKAASPSSKTSNRGPVKLSDIGDIVREAASRKKRGGDGATASPGVRRFGLTERDLTPNTVSDDRQPAYSSTGAFIAFVSNRANATGASVGTKYHIWIMGRDGSGLRQVTGLTTAGANRDDDIDQWQPTFSSDGNTIAYKSLGLAQSAGTTPINTRNAGNLFTVQPFVNTTGIPPFLQVTQFQVGDLDRPSFGANGLTVAFGHSGNIDNNPGDTGNEYDVFTIAPTGQIGSLRRLTGGSAEPAGAASQDRQPAFSLVNPNVLYFTSTRAGGASRIFLMNADGSGKVQITNPTDAQAVDEYAAPSLVTAGTFNFINGNFDQTKGFTERVAFQSNRLAAADDATRDTNIWSLRVDTSRLGPAATPTPLPTPVFVVSAFTGNRLYAYDPAVGGLPQTQSMVDEANSLQSPEGVTFGPDVNNDGFPEVLVSNRGRSRVDAYDGVTLQFDSVFAGEGAINADTSLKNPSALVYSGGAGSAFGTLYVTSGIGAVTGTGMTATTTSTNKIHRYTVINSVARPAPSGGQTGSLFSNGTDGVTNGLEGLELRDGLLYASAFFDDKITSYNAGSGTFTGDFVPVGTGGLDGPTGLAFARQPNGNLFVASSNTDQIKQYVARTGTFVGDFVSDPNGNTFGMNSPEGIVFGPDDNLYVAALNLPGSNQPNGLFVLRFGGPNGAAAGQPLPIGGFGPAFGASTDAVFARTPGLDGPAGIAFFPPDPIRPTPTPTPSTTITVIENTPDFTGAPVTAFLESNTLSAPSLAASSGLDASRQDLAADREPAFSRSTADNQTVAQLAFSSTRTQSSTPNPSTPNPSGGPDTSTGGGSDVNRAGGGPTHDIWVTASEDFTPPILVPVGAGNVQFPVVAPGPQAPFPAPRTFEAGLTSGVPVQIAFVLQDQESGIAQNGAITASFYNADQRRFAPTTSLVNEKVRVRTSLEQKPLPIGTSAFSAYDDGPTGAGGRERQANAVRGDGIFYCEGTFVPPSTSDFYFDINVTDNDGNDFVYDNIWGFSNRQFVKQSTTSDLLVSDYAQGQFFPELTGDTRFFDQADPVESYFLDNPANIAQNPVGLQPDTTTFGAPNDAFNFNSSGNPADVWRILCRGDVPEQVLAAYQPTIVSQVTAIDAAGNPTARGNLPVVGSAVIWASPYTGTVFSGPGTLADSETQRRLTNFLNNGGRMFVTGRDVAFTLSGGGQLTNNFLRDELGASYNGEAPGNTNNTITGVGTGEAGKFTFFENSLVDFYKRPELNNLQVPRRNLDLSDTERLENTFLDASLNQDGQSPDFRSLVNSRVRGTIRTDLIQPTNPAGVIIDPSYELDGARVGQRIERAGRGANQLQSKVVFFAFGLEAINRRYIFPTVRMVQTAYAVNARPIVADNILSYLKTGGISGTVINDRTNLPVPNFLIQISRGNDERYFVRTDANGNYEINGLENTFFATSPFSLLSLDSFIAAPATRVDPNDPNRRISLNPGFLNSFAGAAQVIGIISPTIRPNINFRVIPAPLASLSGVATQSNKTFFDRRDDSVLPNVRVLLRSVTPLPVSSLFPNGEKFAALTTTDAAGRFSFADVPSDVQLEVIFNPDGTFESQGGDIPDRSGIAAFASNTAFGRRRLPDALRPQPIFFASSDPATGNNFILNDVETDTVADEGVPILVPVGRTIAGKVFLNARPLPGATVTIQAAPGVAFSSPASITTATGDYAFFDVPTGSYVLTASFTVAGRLLSDSVTVAVDTTQGRDPVVPNIILRSQNVSGLVTVNNVAPGAPLTVELLNAAGTVVATQQTTAAGAYNFIDVPAGTYTVRATRSGASVSSAPFVVAAFNPATPTTTGDVVVPTINIVALNASGVVTLNGVGTPGLTVQAFNAAGALAATTTSGPGGAFSFANLLGGTFTLVSSVPGRNGTDVGSVTVALSADRTGVELPLFLYTVRGTVRFRGAPAPGQLVEVLQNGVVIATATTDAAGAYAIDRLVAGPAGTAFQVRASRLVGRLVVDQTPLTTVIITRSVDQPLIVDVAPLELVTQVLQGRVFLNNRVVSGAVVQLLQGKRLLLTTRSGAGGVFRFSDLPAGTFTLRATFGGDTVDSTVTLRRGATLGTAELRLFLQSIRGVVQLNNVGLAGQVVELLQGGKVLQRVRSTRGGIYLFSNLAVRAGARAGYTVRATRLGFVAQGNVLNVVRSGRTYVGPTLVLRSQSIRVTVKLNNVAATGATVELLLGTRVVKRGTSGAGGVITFSDLAAGTYIVRATKSGDTAQATVVVNSRVATAANRFTVSVTVNLVLQSIQGTLLANTTPIVGQTITLIQNNRIVATTTSGARGVFTFANLPAGTYTVTVSRNGAAASRTLTLVRGRNASIVLVLALQSVRGAVTLDGRPAAGVSVSLLRGTTPVTAAVTTLANGSFVLSGVPTGTYSLIASVTVAGRTATASRTVRVLAGRDTLVPTIALVTPAPDSGGETFQPGTSYQISVPYTESIAPNSTTTVARAFTVPPVSGGVENYRLFRFNPLSREYELLGANSLIRRGEGYFLQPINRGVSIRTPAIDRTRRPTNVSEFEILLRVNTSDRRPNNGFNLIGFPFDPARVTASTWRNAIVITPDGRERLTVAQAAGRGLVDSNLFTLDNGTDTYNVVANNLVPFQGYYVRTFVNNLRVILRAGDATG